MPIRNPATTIKLPNGANSEYLLSKCNPFIASINPAKYTKKEETTDAENKITNEILFSKKTVE